MKKKIVKFLITIFFGVFGVHKFMDGKKDFGILYLCTFGLFMFGWLFDIVKQSLEIIDEIKGFLHSDLKFQKDEKILNNFEKVNNNINEEKEYEKKCFIFEVETRDYSSERIQNIIDEYIKSGYLDKDELYEGLQNDEIFDVTYQLPDTSFACNIEQFEESDKFGVYMVDNDDNNVFIGYLPSEKIFEFRKIAMFAKNLKGGLSLKGGKYKVYDENKQKLITKKEEFIPTVKLEYYFEDESLVEIKMQEILKEEKEFSEKYFIVSTYIAGKNYNNEDGTSRMEYISSLKEDDQLLLEKYFYQDEKAVKIYTTDKKQIGNIPRDDAEMIFNAIEENKIEKVLFKPKMPNGTIIDYRIHIIIKR